jgi:hypothetical protein
MSVEHGCKLTLRKLPVDAPFISEILSKNSIILIWAFMFIQGQRSRGKTEKPY